MKRGDSESGGCEWQLVAAKRLGAMVRLLAESKSLTTRAEQAEARVAELEAETARLATEVRDLRAVKDAGKLLAAQGKEMAHDQQQGRD